MESNVFYYKGMFIGMCFAQGIKIALETVGYENLTRDAISEGLHSITNFDTGGLYPPVTIDPGYPVVCPYERILIAEGGKLKVVSDWMKMPAVFR